MNNLKSLFDRLWTDYLDLNPDARRIRALLEARGERIVNDHIALRTFSDPRVDIDRMAGPFLAGGYREGDRYDFPDKKLDARHFEHGDPDLPLVFISELRLAECSGGLRETVGRLLGAMPPDLPDRVDFSACGRPWDLSRAEYENLLAESEYAAWVAAFGFRPNHFTIHVNALRTFAGIQELVDFLKAEGFPVNASGGEIKGSPAECLEQASTMANEVPVEFSDGTGLIPSCYYEFAQRYPLPDGTLFRGFIAKSAAKIFESTDRR